MSWFHRFFRWYNEEHHHYGLSLFTPRQVHTGEWIALQQQRQRVLDEAYRRHPERFSRPPVAKPPPSRVWICKPKDDTNKL